MGKGKGKGKKGPGKAAKSKVENDPPVADEFDSMDLEQLKLAIVHRTAKLKKVKSQRNSFQIERDQVQQFYDVVHEEHEKMQVQIRNLETEMESMQETHLNDIRWYMSKVTHLELDHQNNLRQIEKESEANRIEEESRNAAAIEQLKLQRSEMKASLSKQLEANEQEVRSLIGLQKKETKKLREEFERQSSELYQSYQQKLASLQEDLNLQRKMEVHELEERKNLHINDLMENHEKAFTEMRDYYNSITRDNLSLIKSLKDELTELNAKAVQNEKTMEDISTENKRLSEPLAQAQSEVQELQHKLQNFEKDKRSLKLSRARLLVLDHTLKSTTAQHEDLERRFKEVEFERDNLYLTFENTILAVQKKSNAKNIMLEKKLDSYTERYSRKKRQFDEVLAAANLDNSVVTNLTNKLDAVIDSKNMQIKNLRFDIAKVTKAHDDLIRVYEAKLPELGIPSEDLGLQTLADNTLSAPAGLVVK